ncbi:hypothetical protein NGM37_60735, partial [Streptomyces sp. TRM76130]|nr:hypothetical protein [Streptomyces sp. TRM76130]
MTDAPADPGAPEMFRFLRDTGRLPALSVLTDAQLRNVIDSAYVESTRPFTDGEAAHALSTVQTWSRSWNTDRGEMFLPLLADTLDVTVEVLRPDPATGMGTVTRVGSPTTGRVLEVHYWGLNHYTASDAGPLTTPATTPATTTTSPATGTGTGTGTGTVPVSHAPRTPQDTPSAQPPGRHRPAPRRNPADDQPAPRTTTPAHPDTWHHLRPHARPATLHTERFDPHTDPHTDPPRPGTLAGTTTLIRTQIRRIQTPTGHWIRDYTLNLPVTTTDPAHTTRLQQRLTTLVDTHLNNRYLLPTSHDQFHLNITLHSHPTHPETITLTHTPHPTRPDQRHLDLSHTDTQLLHELLHYLGLPDEQHDNDHLFRNHPHSTAVHADGLMATTTPTTPIPHRYLATIEDLTDTHTRLHNHPHDPTHTPDTNPETTPTDPDATPLPATDPPTWPTSHAPTADPPARTALPSSYVNSYGSVPDGKVGLVYLEPFTEQVTEGLHRQVYEALGLDADDPPESVRDQVRDRLSRESLALHLPYLRANGGHRVTVRIGGRDRTVDVRLTLADPRASLRQGRFDARDPDKHVERRGLGTRENFSGQPSGTYRT